MSLLNKEPRLKVYVHLLVTLFILFTSLSYIKFYLVPKNEASKMSERQVQIQAMGMFDKDSFDSFAYTRNGIVYISDRILFPATINGEKLMLEMNIDRPADNGTYPVLLLTHGRNGPFPKERNRQICRCYDDIKSLFLKEHLVFVQLARRGEGLSEGSNRDEYKMTPIDSGMEMVKDIEQALVYLRTKPYVNKKKFIIGGHSQGGWAALAAASAELDGAVCILNFSGATNYRRQPWSENWPQKASLDFVRDCKILGQTSKVPSLWIYGDHEPLNGKSEIENWYHAYNESGGKAELIFLPNTGHQTLSLGTQKIWGQSVIAFLTKHNVFDTALPQQK